jgi:AraC-like DNA-binding protein
VLISFIKFEEINCSSIIFILLLKDFIPSQAVSEYVQTYRIIHFIFSSNEQLPFKAYPPRPEHCLAFYPFDTETVEYADSGRKIHSLPVVLYGQQLSVTNRFVGRTFLVFQIIFHPGALFRLTGIPANELTNEYLDAEVVFSGDLRFINEQLYHARSYNDMLLIADAFLHELIRNKKKAHHAIDEISKYMLKENGNLPLEEMVKQSFLSYKQFERKFKERTGVNPKLFSRIARFDKAFRMKNSFPHFDWLRIAVECNYHDYQHLVRDYKDFTGMTPTSFHEIESKAPERNFGLAETIRKPD